MRVKIGTSVEKALVDRLHALARRKGRPLNDLMEEAIGRYLNAAEGVDLDVVARTWASFQVDRRVLRQVMDEDLYES
ncbi:MAG: ribbon-helix-helix protein, CopG family [Candidatus Xenobia bacterium]